MTDKRQDYTLLNGLTLAYMGDAVFEQFIRAYLLTTGSTKPNKLHQQATQYVSAKAQADFSEQLLQQELLTQEETDIFKRGRNAKSHTTAKNADVKTYRTSTGFEALIGYLYLTEQHERLTELMNWCIAQKEKTK